MAHIELKGYNIIIDGEVFEIPSTLVLYRADPYHSIPINIPINIDRIEDLVKLTALLKDKEFSESLYKLYTYSEIEYGKIIHKIMDNLENLEDLTNKEEIEKIKDMAKKRALYIGIIKGQVNIINIVNDYELLDLFTKISDNKKLLMKYAKYIVENKDKLRNKEEVEKLKNKIKRTIRLSESNKEKHREIIEYILSTIENIKQKIKFDYTVDEDHYFYKYMLGVKLYNNNILIIDLHEHNYETYDMDITLIDKEMNIYEAGYTNIPKSSIQNYQIAKILKLLEDNKMEELIEYLKSRLMRIDNENSKKDIIEGTINRLSQINDKKIEDAVFRLKAYLI